jgi:hypothetical protein
MMMARLTDEEVMRLPMGKYFDGGNLGLFIRVDEKGRRFWVQRINVNGKRREIGLGSMPLTTVAMAREKAKKNKIDAMNSIDPIAGKREANADKIIIRASLHIDAIDGGSLQMMVDEYNELRDAIQMAEERCNELLKRIRGATK